MDDKVYVVRGCPRRGNQKVIGVMVRLQGMTPLFQSGLATIRDSEAQRFGWPNSAACQRYEVWVPVNEMAGRGQPGG
jgi:hypothetical protein